MDPTLIAQNDAERARLRQLVARLTDGELGRPIDDQWCVSTALAHLALWDRRGMLMLERWTKGEPPPREDDWQAEVLNAAALPTWNALAPREAARLAVEAAEAVDAYVTTLDESVVRAITERDETWRIHRARHRCEHLDQIETALKGG